MFCFCIGKRKKISEKLDKRLSEYDYALNTYVNDTENNIIYLEDSFSDNNIDNSTMSTFMENEIELFNIHIDKKYYNLILKLSFNEIKTLLEITKIYYNDNDNYISFTLGHKLSGTIFYIYSYINIENDTDLKTRQHINMTSINRLVNFINNTYDNIELIKNIKNYINSINHNQQN